MDITTTLKATVSQRRLGRGAVDRLLMGLGCGQLSLREEGWQRQYTSGRAGPQAHIDIHDARFYSAVLFGGSIGAAEAYVNGWWSSPDLTTLVELITLNQQLLQKMERRLAWLGYGRHWLAHRMRRNSERGSRANIAAHYDLGNELYACFLDKHMQYSAGIYPAVEASLEQAQQHKLRIICDKLALTEHDHLLEIGTGWGGLALFAAKHYGCRVTTTTISREQHQFASQRVAEAGLGQRITLLQRDYRQLQGQYSKLVSVEMIEAVGYAYLPTFFQTLERLLEPGGRLLIQAITIRDQQFDAYRRGVDFIQRYIFPGGCLPSVQEMSRLLKAKTQMSMVRLEDFGAHYARTLADWRQRFLQAESQLEQLGYSEDFRRLWQFYFSYCEGGFRARATSLVQLEAEKSGGLA